MSKSNTSSIKEDLIEFLSKNNHTFEEDWNKITASLSYKLIDYIQDKVTINDKFIKKITDFKITITVDTNFIFYHINGIIKGNGKLENSLLYKICTSKLFEIYAPQKLAYELHEIIDREITTEHSDFRLETDTKLPVMLLKSQKSKAPFPPALGKRPRP